MILIYFAILESKDMGTDLFLFDVDGTLCASGQRISLEMTRVLQSLRKTGAQIALVGGGTKEKILDQLGNQMDNQIKYDYLLAESGQDSVNGSGERLFIKETWGLNGAISCYVE